MPWQAAAADVRALHPIGWNQRRKKDRERWTLRSSAFPDGIPGQRILRNFGQTYGTAKIVSRRYRKIAGTTACTLMKIRASPEKRTASGEDSSTELINLIPSSSISLRGTLNLWILWIVFSWKQRGTCSKTQVIHEKPCRHGIKPWSASTSARCISNIMPLIRTLLKNRQRCCIPIALWPIEFLTILIFKVPA